MTADDIWNPPPQTIAVFRALQLGGLLCAVPALRALRAHAPHAKITLIGLAWATSFVERFHRYVDNLLPFPGFPGFPEQEGSIEGLLEFSYVTQQRQFDLAIQLHGSGEYSNAVVALMGARRWAGFHPPQSGCPDPRTFIPWPVDRPEVLCLLDLMSHLGVRALGTHLELPLSASDWAEGRRLIAYLGLAPRQFVCLHPGARLPSRRWPLERFAEVGRAVADDGRRIVVTGAAEEAPLTGSLAAQIGPAAVDAAGRTSLGSLAVMLAKSALVVCNDTGVSHVAAAMRVPSVVIASGTDAARWAPLDRDLHRVLAHDVPCRPCRHQTCPIGHPCALGIGVPPVLAEARRLLRRTFPGRLDDWMSTPSEVTS